MDIFYEQVRYTKHFEISLEMYTCRIVHRHRVTRVWLIALLFQNILYNTYDRVMKVFHGIKSQFKYFRESLYQSYLVK